MPEGNKTTYVNKTKENRKKARGYIKSQIETAQSSDEQKTVDQIALDASCMFPLEFEEAKQFVQRVIDIMNVSVEGGVIKK